MTLLILNVEDNRSPYPQHSVLLGTIAATIPSAGGDKTYPRCP